MKLKIKKCTPKSNKLHCFGKPGPGEISITEEMSDNTERKHRTIEQDIKDVGPHEGGNHRTIKQAIKAADPQREAGAGQKSRLKK